MFIFISLKIISKLLDQLNINYIIEYHIAEINNFCDYFLPEYNTIIEFYGCYWHCNPELYDKNYYHSYSKRTAGEIWISDKKRINKIYEHYNKNITIIIIWENRILNSEFLNKILNENKNVILYI